MSESRIEEGDWRSKPTTEYTTGDTRAAVSEGYAVPRDVTARMFAAIDEQLATLTRERDELKAACEEVVHTYDNRPRLELIMSSESMFAIVADTCRTALAATASGKGGSS